MYDLVLGDSLKMWHFIGIGPTWSVLETEIWRKIGEMVNKLKKKDFPYFGVLGQQKHSHIGSILKKSFQGSIHAQLYMAIKGPFGRFQLQPCTVNLK